jgi:chromate transporter
MSDSRSAGAADEDAGIPRLSQGQIFRRFLRFGLLAWGGPVAQIAMIRRELVEEERWISSARFNRLLAVYQVLPGPEAHELCVHMGMLAGRRLGGILAGLGFMLPGFVLMLALSWLYLSAGLAGTLAAAAFLGVQPAVVALIARAVHRIGKHVLLDRWLWALALLTGAAAFAGAPFWLTLPVSALAYMSVARHRTAAALLVAVLAGLAVAYGWSMSAGAPVEVASAVRPVAQGQPSGIELFLSGLKAGLLTFGGAYTAIPFLREDAVGRGWMTDAQFLDGLALSGILPAPLIIFSTFVGYSGGGLAGAILITAGIFLPAFAFGLFFHSQLEALVENRAIHSFLEGVAAGVIGLIAATTAELAYTTLASFTAVWAPLAIFALSLAALYAFKATTTVVWVVFGAALAGIVLFG